MRTLQLFSFLFIISFCAFSCGKSDDGGSAGKGGSANLTINMTHHGVGRNIYNGTAYIKYNTLDKPADNIYDDSLTTSSTDTIQVATFTGLKNGNYYLYGKGCDTSPSTLQQVIGGIKYTISAQTNQTYTIPVSENGIPCN